MWSYNNTLCHHGIKGQKWYVRNYQNEDGSLTIAGRIRYGVGKGLKDKNRDAVNKNISNKKPSKREINLRNKYESKGMSEEEAAVKAHGRAKTEKYLAIAGATTAAAALAYIGYKKSAQVRSELFVQHHKNDIINDYIRDNAGIEDFSIRRGTKFQRITATPNESVSNSTYNTFLDNDKERYSVFMKSYADKRYKITSSASRDINIAGEKSRKRIFDDLVKEDDDFKSFYNEYLKESKRFKADPSEYAYDRFNWKMLGPPGNDRSSRMRKTFISALKDKGYDGVVDYNDRWYPYNENFIDEYFTDRHINYGPQLPVILNNMQDGITKRKIREIMP